MLFRILKLFGFDLSAKIDAAAAGLEYQVEQVSDHVKQVAREAAVIAALSASATMTGAMAAGVGLVALYRWTAERSGAYAGLEADGALLLVVTCVLAAAAIVKSRKSFPRKAFRISRSPSRTDSETDPPALLKTDMNDESRAERTHHGHAQLDPPREAKPKKRVASETDVLEPLAFFLSKVVNSPSGANPLVDELIGTFRASAEGTPDEAIGRAADGIRYGDRKDLVIILTGAAFVGWLLTRQPRR
jgi:hypothetical protein